MIVVKKYHLVSGQAVYLTMAKKKIEQLTPQQYADKCGITLSAVTEGIRKERVMPGVVKVTSFGRFYVLDVDIDQLNKTLKK